MKATIVTCVLLLGLPADSAVRLPSTPSGLKLCTGLASFGCYTEDDEQCI